ncbi:MAG TPA: SpoIIIAC/SpoIIIAD family protein [Pseudoflavonifractor sp.]|jgi:stage III sporulation protein AD|nr:SpoIIIAC/SpoIIIAD family protein [Pseudoflavonifractor sp.]
MTDILKLAAIAIISAICAVVVKKNVQELGLVLALTAGVLLLSYALGAIESARDLLDMLADTAGLEPAVLAPVIKTVGIAIVTHVSAEVCRDAKEGGIASFLETAGAACALFVALPLVRAVLDMVMGLL